MTRTDRAALLFGICLGSAVLLGHAERPAEPLAELGRLLFFDANLSLDRTQSCATCHDPAHAFTDGRDNGVAGAASLGDDGRSLGDRNAPTLTYAFLAPPFERDSNGDFVGGLFLDGRSATLADQAAEPFVNPLEMRMPDAAAVVSRVRENPVYTSALQRLFGDGVLAGTDRAYRAIGQSLAAFEQTELFASFDSRYDRYLRGESQLTAAEELGRELFFSQLTNCSSCHVLDPHGSHSTREPFTNYGYHNIGVPPNEALLLRNHRGTGYRDLGLLRNPNIEDAAQAGKFRVPTLRNVAVTGPYMHNGVFTKLSTAIHFYSQYTVHNHGTLTNPETGASWPEPEVPATIDLDLLEQGQPLDADRIAVLEAFLRTLTDRRYEPLLSP